MDTTTLEETLIEMQEKLEKDLSFARKGLLEAQRMYETKHKIEDQLKKISPTLTEEAQLTIRKLIPVWRNLPKPHYFVSLEQAVKSLTPTMEMIQSLREIESISVPGTNRNITIDEARIREGAFFDARKVLRDIFSLANEKILIKDNYLKPAIIDVLYEYLDDANELQIELIVSAKAKNKIPPIKDAVLAASMDFENRLKLAISDNANHSRFILIDNQTLFQPDHSLADWADGGATIHEVKDVNTRNGLIKQLNSEFLANIVKF